MAKLTDESICIGKDGTCNENGDHIFDGKHFKAVFDGSTPKGERLWEGLPGDIYASSVLCDALNDADPNICAAAMIIYLNDKIRKSYAANRVSFDDLPPEERLQVSAIIYSRQRREVWSFGDCSVKMFLSLRYHTHRNRRSWSDDNAETEKRSAQLISPTHVKNTKRYGIG